MSDSVLLSHLLELTFFHDWGQHVGLLAQTFEDNLGSNFGNAWDNFIESGQVWALGIGLILGYIFRSFTAY